MFFGLLRTPKSRRSSRDRSPADSCPTKSGKRRRRWLIVAGVAVVLGGIVFYLTSAKTLGEPITMEYGAVERAFRDSIGSLLGHPFTEGNHVEALVNGAKVFPAMIEAIRGAKESVTLETYIWASGRVNEAFMEALLDRARHGVKVHALADGVGTIRLKESEIRRMKEGGVEFVLYEREHWYQLKLNVNHRTHRKLLVVDGRVGFIGGVCIDDSWFGDAESLEVWRDTQYRVEGPAVKQMQAIFVQNWLQTTGRLLQGPRYFPPDFAAGSMRVQAWQSGPQEGPEQARMAYLMAIAAARDSIKLSHAYFVPDDLAIEMLLAARMRGVEIEVIVPWITDSPIGRAASRSRWGRLLAGGVSFYQYTPALYHCKAMIVDDIFVTVGSVNFDNRSFSINDEANINVIDRGFAREQLRIFEEDRRDSKPLTLADFEARAWWIKLWDHACGVLRSQF